MQQYHRQQQLQHEDNEIEGPEIQEVKEGEEPPRSAEFRDRGPGGRERGGERRTGERERGAGRERSVLGRMGRGTHTT